MSTRLQPKHLAAVLFGIAGLLLIATFTRNWFSADDSGLGLLGVKFCRGGSCEGRTWFGTPHAPISIVLLSSLGLIAGLLSAVFLAQTGAMVNQGKLESSHVSRVKTALGLTGAVAVIFVIRIYSEEHSGLHLGWSAILALACVIGGLVAVISFAEPLQTAGNLAVQAYAVGAPPNGTVPQGQPFRGYPLSMQLGMQRMHGHLFLAPNRLYFLCVKQGGAWLAVAGQALGGAVGGALMGLAASGTGAAPAIYDEATLHQYAQQMPGSMVLEAPQIQEIKQTLFWRIIRANGNKYGLPQGLGSDLKAALGPWARYHQVKTTGFA
jgi:hypothetical protein